ncbi:MAG: DNA oxidative demethylase AlkB [Gammaproteobacteria bacterium]|jgi:alkylated DNA repair protein (DNA oxidative demethylase)|nr:DNA oxidative demethylase AlkB [Gammaproteobacteria bacterium]
MSSLERIDLGMEAAVLRGQALTHAEALLAELETIERQAPPRRMETPGGRVMSVSMTNCGPLGWISDRGGYRYSATDPLTGNAWPAMPEVFAHVARSAAAALGHDEYRPDACLINHYRPGTTLSLHQDRDERDLTAPIVSVSLGMSAIFVFGGLKRRDPVQAIELHHGDVVVWGGRDRLRYHGIRRLCGPAHPLFGDARINLTFRRAR